MNKRESSLGSARAKRYSGIDPEHRSALVVGLDYEWKRKDWWLETCEREALQVARQLKKKGYSVVALRGEEATKRIVERTLSKGVSIFHFSGHGAYKTRQPEGKRGSLLLADGELTEDDLKGCFEKAKGAPFLSFLNACESPKEIYSSHLLDAFVEYGAESVIGTFWSIYDYPSTQFASRFYREVASGKTFAHALQLSRWQFFHKRSFQEAATWPAFVLYGSPTTWLKRAPRSSAS
jgi:CHAT domain-containing protein